jgi:hypothetical protein
VATAVKEETVDETMEVEEAFYPIEYWNPHLPNERIYEPGNGDDPAAVRHVDFMAGYYRATEPWQVALIEEYVPRAYVADTTRLITCHRCGWATKSSEAFEVHTRNCGTA